MLAKITSKNQITIPKKIMDHLRDTKYFEVEFRDGTVVLRPLKTYGTSLDAIRAKIKAIDLNPDCVTEAIEWARSK